MARMNLIIILSIVVIIYSVFFVYLIDTINITEKTWDFAVYVIEEGMNRSHEGMDSIWESFRLLAKIIKERNFSIGNNTIDPEEIWGYQNRSLSILPEVGKW